MPKIRARIIGIDIAVDTDFLETQELMLPDIISYFEEKHREVQNKDPNIVDTQKAVIVAALKIASELFKIKGMYNNISDSYEKKINEMIKLIDETGLID
jgi:cell division protein ZapA (FtsZ GTPase activity inhibitor)